MSRVIACLNASRRIPNFIACARLVAVSMRQDPRFADADRPIKVLEGHLSALQEAEVFTLTRTLGAVSLRDARLAEVRGDLAVLRCYVQRLADADAANSASIIEGSGFNVKHSSGHGKPGFEVKLGRVLGSVHLVARAEDRRASYDWEYGRDEVTWTRLETTLRADQSLDGLTPGVRYFFRYRSITSAGKGDWSQTVSMLVL